MAKSRIGPGGRLYIPSDVNPGTWIQPGTSAKETGTSTRIMDSISESMDQGKPEPESSGGGDGGGGGGGGGGGSAPNPFPNPKANLPTTEEVQQGYQQSIEKGQKLLEALGHESFRDLAAAAFANKFTLPDNFEQMLSGEGSQPVTQANQLPQYNPGLVGTQARTALQKGVSTLPQTGGPQMPGVPPSMISGGTNNAT